MHVLLNGEAGSKGQMAPFAPKSCTHDRAVLLLFGELISNLRS